MKKLTLVILLLVSTLSQPTNAATSVYTTLGSMMSGVRNKIAEYSKALPDSVVKQACRDGLLAVSTEAGGLYAHYRIVTDTNVSFYAIPDTIVEVAKVTLINGKIVRSIRPIDPDYYEYTGEQLPTQLGQSFNSDESDVPFGYDVWADTIQFSPAPVKIDTVYLKCLVEHPRIDSTGTILLKPSFTEAALWYACQIACEYLQDYEKSAYFEQKYEKKIAKLLVRYRPKYARGTKD